MSVSNDQVANATNFNDAFVSKSSSSTMTGVLTLNNAGTGSAVANAQQDINTLKSDVTAAEGDITTLQGSLATAEGEIDTLQAEMVTLLSVATDADATGADASLAAINSGVVALTNVGLTSVGGIPAGTDGQTFTLINRTGNDIQIKDSFTTSEFIYTGTGSAIELIDDAALTLRYDLTEQCWQVVGGSGSGAAGFSDMIISWEDNGPESPVSSFENYNRVYLFEAGFTNKINAEIIVPFDYVAGRPITLYAQVLCADTSGTISMNATSTLIKPGVDLYTSTTNQRTSNSAAITMTGSNANKILTFAIDVTDSVGEINLTAVGLGDRVFVTLFRDSDTATGDVKLLDKAQVIFKAP